MMYRTGIIALVLTVLLSFSACGEEPAGGGGEGTDTNGTETADQPVRGDWIRVFQPSDPDALHPFASTHATSTFIKEGTIFQYLCDIHPETMELVPVLVKDFAEISENMMAYTFEFRDEAKWDNGDPIDGYDYEFTFKAIKNPLAEAQHVRGYYNFLKDIKVDPNNPKRVTAYIAEPFFLTETALSGIDVISRKFYDPEDRLAKFRVLDFYERADELQEDPDVIAFSENFHDEKYKSDPEYIYGSGPYKVSNWTPGDNVTLERKENWWGDQSPEEGYGFHAYADKIIFKTITDRITAVQAAASGELDVMQDVPADEFNRIKEEGGAIMENFNLHTPETYILVAIAMNGRPPADRTPFFEDKRVRRALAHLTDIDKIINNIYGGYGTPTNGPILPIQKKEFNPDLEPIKFDPEKAAQLLDEAGWIDTDGNGLRDKMIRGKKVDFEVDLMVSQSSSTAPRLAGLLAKEAEDVGLKINVQKLDFRVATKNALQHQFDMFGTAFSASPLPPDFRQVWHTDSWKNFGSNYMGFGNTHTDSLIEKLRVTLDAEERLPIYYEMQEIIQDEAPAIFLMCPQNRVIINKRFKNAKASLLRPGYKLTEFYTPKDQQKFSSAN